MYSFPGERITSNPTFGFPPVRSVDNPVYGFPQRPKPGILQEMQRVKGRTGNQFVKSVEVINSGVNTDSAGMCLADDGCIYVTPNNLGIILRWDTATNTFTQIGSVVAGINNYSYSCYLNGAVYIAPGAAGIMLGIDTYTKTVFTITIPAGVLRYSIAASPVTGNIYTAPVGLGAIQEYNPEAKTIYQIGAGLSNIYGMIPHPNGRLYALNVTSQNVLEFDPTTLNISFFGVINNHYHSALGYNGKIYAIGSGTTTVLEIDVENRTTSTFGSINQTNNNYFNPLRPAPNGKLYSYPYLLRQNGQILEIDIEKKTVSQIGALGLSPGSNGFGITFGMDGCMYIGAPQVAPAVFKKISFTDVRPASIAILSTITAPAPMSSYSASPESWSRWALLSPYLNRN